jgi:hypothetical protein
MLSSWAIDGWTGSTTVVERAFVVQPPSRLRPFVEIGIFRLGAMVRELAAGGRRITPAASGVHGQRVIALNGFSCSG